jgi:predicted DNA binding CopG/RHH family protein
MDNKLLLNYLQTDNTGVDSMTEKENWRKQMQVSLSENQIAAIDKAAANMGLKRSEYIRWVMSQVIEDFPDDQPIRGENLKKKVS